MKKSTWTTYFFLAGFFALATLFFVPSIASAQFVPVQDADLIAEFQTFSGNFDTFSNNFDRYAQDMNDILLNNPDSLRNIITGADLALGTVGECTRGNNMEGQNEDAFAYSQGPWASSSAIAGIPNTVPAGGGYVQVNYSHSLRCLLEEVVEWQKLGLSVQIHQLLKNYIADAQTAQLQNQLINKISAANINWANAGNVVNNNSVISNSPVFNTNASQNLYNVKGRVLEHVVDQCASDPLSGNPIGSLGINVDWRNKVCAATARNGRSSVEDPFYYTNSVTRTTLTTYLNPGDSPKFFASFNDPATNALGQGSLQTFHSMLTEDANSPLNSGWQTDMASQRDMRAQEDAKRIEFESSGFLNKTECSGTPDDPHCVEKNSRATIPGAENQRSVGVSSGAGQEQAARADTLDSGGGNAAEAQTGEIARNGLTGYNTTGLQLSQTAVNALVKEFYDAINIGYFGVRTDTREWAQATMLMIYDEMEFNPNTTEVVVTDGAGGDLPTGYGGNP